MIAITLIVLFVITGIVKYFLHMRHMESYVKHLKIKEPVYPFFGNSLLLVGKTTTQIFNELIDYMRKFDTPIKSYLGPFLVVSTDRPEDFKTVLMSPNCLDKPYIYQFFPSEAGLMSATSSSIWKPIRKMINPSFNLKLLQTFIPIFNEKIKILVENLDDEVGNGQFDILHYMNACTLDMVSATSMDYNVDVQRNKNREFLHSIEEFFEIVGRRFMKIWAHTDFVFRWTDLYREQQKHLTNLHALTTHMYEIKKRKYISENKKSAVENVNDESFKKPQILVDLLLDLIQSGKIDEKTALDEIETILIAGNETTALAVSFVILILAMHPEIQENVYDELRTVYNSQDEDTTNEHFQKLSYLDRVIKETLRLYPVGPFMIRKAMADIQLSKCTVPKNTYITLSLFNLHRRTDVWGESADEFNPDNFLPENVAKRHPFSYLPFGSGPRNCIGYQYGMMSMKTMISAILRHFKFTTDLRLSDLQLHFQITLKLCNKHMVGVERRVW